MSRRARRAAVGPAQGSNQGGSNEDQADPRTSDLRHYALAPLYATALPKGRVPSISRLIR
jgi:hypothetical protein